MLMLSFSLSHAYAQENKPVFGIVIKPIIPSSLFSNNNLIYTHDDIRYTYYPKPALSFGADMRLGLFRQFSAESGILYTRRKYGLTVQGVAGNAQTSFTIVNYEIPLLGMVYIRLSQKSFINTAFGFSFDFYPNDIYLEKDSLHLLGRRPSWVEPALLANIGVEYHTLHQGYFYVGAAYHRLLSHMMAMRIDYYGNSYHTFQNYLDGHYFALEFKWFFPNNPANSHSQ